MSDQPTLFDTAPVAEPWYVRRPASVMDRKRALIWRGQHPLSGVASAGHLALHPDTTLTCGGCRFFEHQPGQGEGPFPAAPKCVLGATRDADGRVTAAPRYLVPVKGHSYPAAMEDLDSDLCDWFPACKSYEPRETA